MSVISRSEICLKIEVLTFDWVHWCWHSNPYPFFKLLGYSAWILLFNATRHSLIGFLPLQNFLISSSKLATSYSFMDIEYPRCSLFRYFIICYSNSMAKWQWHLHNRPPPLHCMIDCDQFWIIENVTQINQELRNVYFKHMKSICFVIMYII